MQHGFILENHGKYLIIQMKIYCLYNKLQTNNWKCISAIQIKEETSICYTSPA